MAGQLLSILRIWAGRLLIFVLAAAVVAAVAYLPYGVVLLEGRPQATGYLGLVRTEATVPFRIEPIREPGDEMVRGWSFSHYGQALRAYGVDLIAGEVTTWNRSVSPPREEPLMPVIQRTWSASLTLFAAAVGIGLLIGFGVGLLILGTRVARAFSVGISVLGLAVPDFFLVLLGQMATIWTFRNYGVRLWSVLGPQGGERGWVLPLIALAAMPIAYTARLVATALGEVMQEEYIRTARAKGVAEFWVVVKHGMRNALPRVLNGLPSMLNATLSSLLVVEILTSIDGLGPVLLGASSSAVVATAGILFCAWFTVIDGLANTLRVMANPQLRGLS